MDFNKMMAQAKKLQAQIEKEEQEFKQNIFNFEKQGIKLSMNGACQIVALDIHEVLIDPEDKETLQDLIVITINDAIDEILKKKEAIKNKATQGMF